MSLTSVRLSKVVLSRFSDFADHREVFVVSDADAGLEAIIAVHDRTLGPALGGCRMWTYENRDAAIRDALRLSHGMTLKNALAGLDYGGGKAVIMADPRTDKTPELFRAFGRAVESLAGRYITAEDVGIDADDMAVIGETTAHARGTRNSGLGDPSPFTALGVFHGILAAIRFRFGTDQLSGLTASVKGLGHVGMRVAEKLHMAGAKLLVCDIHPEAVNRAVRRFGADVVDADRAHSVAADLFVPCALGGDLNARTIPEMKAPIVAGAANNQLSEPEDAARLTSCGILHAPDYAINAGGVIAVALGKPGSRPADVVPKVEAIGATLASIFSRSQLEGLPTTVIANRLAGERLMATVAKTAA